MTVIRPNSVSGINSITAQADEIKVFKSNGTQGGLIIGGANLNATTGISTILALNVTGNVSIAGTLTYQDVTNVDSLGIGTFRTGINVSGGQLDVGSNIKIGNAGVITATSFSGSGANLTGLNSDLVNDSSPQLGGILDTNGNDIDFADNVKVTFGASEDLLIKHSGTNSEIYHNGTGHLYIAAQGSGEMLLLQAAADIRLSNSVSGDMYLKGISDGSIELYHNGSKKYESQEVGANFYGRSVDCQLRLKTSDGTTRGNIYAYNDNSIAFLDAAGSYSFRANSDKTVTFFNHGLPNANNSYDLGSTSYRWRNLYVNDLQLSNEAKKDTGGNDVDGTWGNYTIQEGESDLFLINNRNGKKYKFNLTEVS